MSPNGHIFGSLHRKRTMTIPKAHVQFWSSVECGPLAHSLISELRNEGWDAAHCFHVSQFTYRKTRSKIASLWLRFRMYICYPVYMIWRILLSPKPLIAVVSTNTFYVPLLASMVGRVWNVKVVHLVYDLYPDALLISGHVKHGSLIEKALSTVTKMTITRCERNVFLGEHLVRCAAERYRDIPRASVIPVGAEGRIFEDNPPANNANSELLTVLYCGNLGYMHDIATFNDALSEDTDGSLGNFQFLFHANGPRLEALKELIAALPAYAYGSIRIETSLSQEDWVKTMFAADIAFVTMVPGAEKVVMPSKAYSALMAGQAILAVCPRRSDLAETVLKHDCGWVVEPGDADGLRRLLKELASDPEQVYEKRVRAFSAGHRIFDTRVVAKQWASLFKEMGAKPEHHDTS